MATFSKLTLSGSTNGRPIKVTGTTTGAAVTVHTAHASAIDEIWLYITNTSSTAAKITLEWGGVTSPDDHIVMDIEAESTVQVAPGFILTNSLLVKAFAETADVLNIVGWVNRIS